ncbi:MAG TPA: alpha/beta fold hydrolase, partial [Actinomycetes bacterium]
MSATDQPARPPGGAASPVLFARRRGEGRPLVLLHGLLVSGELFAPVLDALAAHHQLIVPHLRGHGRSAHLPGPDTVEQLADDVALLLDALGVGQADVLGYSQGGAVAQQFARAHPGRVRRLVLACTYAHNALSPRERLEGWLTPWVLRALGPGRLAALVGGAGGGAPLSREQVAA